MPDFRPHYKIEHLGPAEYTVIVSTVPEGPEGKADVVMEDATSRQQAEEMARVPMVMLEAQITRVGHAVIERAAG